MTQSSRCAKRPRRPGRASSSTWSSGPTWCRRELSSTSAAASSTTRRRRPSAASACWAWRRRRKRWRTSSKKTSLPPTRGDTTRRAPTFGSTVSTLLCRNSFKTLQTNLGLFSFLEDTNLVFLSFCHKMNDFVGKQCKAMNNLETLENYLNDFCLNNGKYNHL